MGDLFLIPPGTSHGHGGNQMVLEMDTCPSVAATEYSFFMYDFARSSWDDRTKTMTGKPADLAADLHIAQVQRRERVGPQEVVGQEARVDHDAHAPAQ